MIWKVSCLFFVPLNDVVERQVLVVIVADQDLLGPEGSQVLEVLTVALGFLFGFCDIIGLNLQENTYRVNL